jgi:NAD(P)-dependent dehydrogenase (short-subunit alcohol dehydrogenase family)
MDLEFSGQVALITGGSEGIGKAAAAELAREGVNVVICARRQDVLDEAAAEIRADAKGEVVAISCDVSQRDAIDALVKQIADRFGRLDIVVNNAAEQHERESIADVSAESLLRVFRTNIFSHFYMTKAALKHLGRGSSVINSTSVTAYMGHKTLLDYATTKGAIVAFTRSLALMLAEKGIRVNGVAPGPIWTPLIPASFDEDKVEEFGANTALGRPGQPEEVAPSYVFLASDDASYMTGQVLHPNGGRIVNG